MAENQGAMASPVVASVKDDTRLPLSPSVASNSMAHSKTSLFKPVPQTMPQLTPSVSSASLTAQLLRHGSDRALSTPSPTRAGTSTPDAAIRWSAPGGQGPYAQRLAPHIHSPVVPRPSTSQPRFFPASHSRLPRFSIGGGRSRPGTMTASTSGGVTALQRPHSSVATSASRRAGRWSVAGHERGARGGQARPAAKPKPRARTKPKVKPAAAATATTAPKPRRRSSSRSRRSRRSRSRSRGKAGGARDTATPASEATSVSAAPPAPSASPVPVATETGMLDASARWRPRPASTPAGATRSVTRRSTTRPTNVPRVATLAPGPHLLGGVSADASATLGSTWMGKPLGSTLSTTLSRSTAPMKPPSCASERFTTFKPTHVLTALEEACGAGPDPDSMGFVSLAGMVDVAVKANRSQLTQLVKQAFVAEAVALLALSVDDLAPTGATAPYVEGPRRAQLELLLKQAVRQEQLQWRRATQEAADKAVLEREAQRERRDWNKSNKRLEEVVLRDAETLAARRERLLAERAKAEERYQRAVERRHKAKLEMQERGRKRHEHIVLTKERAQLLAALQQKKAAQQLETKQQLHRKAREELKKRHAAAVKAQHERYKVMQKQVEEVRADEMAMAETKHAQMRAREANAVEYKAMLAEMTRARLQDKSDEKIHRTQLQQTAQLQKRAEEAVRATLTKESSDVTRRVMEARTREAAECQKQRIINRHAFIATQPLRNETPGPGEYAVPSSLDSSSGARFSTSVVLGEFGHAEKQARHLPGPAEYGSVEFKATGPRAEFGTSSNSWLDPPTTL